MFLMDSAQAAADWDGTLSVINTILERADAEVVSMQKWQERKLAYDIDHKTRGTYILCYFKADGSRIAGIEKDVLLSEKVMRVLVLGTEKRPPEMIERDIKGEPEEKPAEPTAAPEKAAAPAEKPAEAPAAPEQAGPVPVAPAEAPQEAAPVPATAPAESVEAPAEPAGESATEVAVPEPAPEAVAEEPEKAPE
jgi:ribosomal protein S6